MRWSPDRELARAWLDAESTTASEDDKRFCQLIKYGLELTRLSDAAFAELVNMSRPTVSRWRLGQSVAHPSIRFTIFSILKKEVLKADLRASCGLWEDGENEAFANLVGFYLNLWTDGRQALADEFEAAPATVTRWAKGVSRPRLRMRRDVVAWIGQKAGGKR